MNLHRIPSQPTEAENLRKTGLLSTSSKWLVGCLPAVIAAIAVTVLAGSEDKDKGSSANAPRMVFAVTHAQVNTILVTPGSPAHQLGDLRVLPATPILNEFGQVSGRLDANLLTTSVNYPEIGDEVRMSTLNFVFGEGDAQLSGLADQLVVSGSGFYPGTGSTIAPGTSLVRPVTGGSGKFAGARGWAESEHLSDGTWRHTFHIQTDANHW